MQRKIDPAIPPAYAAEPHLLLQRASPAFRSALLAAPARERFGALLAGPTGAGKSSAAAWLVRRWKASMWAKEPYEGLTLAWLDALEATDAERRYRLGSGDPAELEQAYSAQWLVLDDVGRSSSAVLVQLILARRYQACKPTIVTTGLTPEELAAHVGAATVRRVVEWEGKPGLFVNAFPRAA